MQYSNLYWQNTAFLILCFQLVSYLTSTANAGRDMLILPPNNCCKGIFLVRKCCSLVQLFHMIIFHVFHQVAVSVNVSVILCQRLSATRIIYNQFLKLAQSRTFVLPNSSYPLCNVKKHDVHWLSLSVTQKAVFSHRSMEIKILIDVKQLPIITGSE